MQDVKLVTDHLRERLVVDTNLFLLPGGIHIVERYTAARLAHPLHYYRVDAGNYSRQVCDLEIGQTGLGKTLLSDDEVVQLDPKEYIRAAESSRKPIGIVHDSRFRDNLERVLLTAHAIYDLGPSYPFEPAFSNSRRYRTDVYARMNPSEFPKAVAQHMAEFYNANKAALLLWLGYGLGTNRGPDIIAFISSSGEMHAKLGVLILEKSSEHL